MSTIITPSEEQINIVVNDEKISINVESGDVIVNVNEQIVEVSTVNGGYPLPTTVYSVFGRTGNIIATEGDYDLNKLSDVTLASSTNGDVLSYDGTKWINKAVTGTGSVTSVGLSTNGGAITIGSSPVTTSGVISFNFNGTNLQYVNGAGNLTTFPILTGYVPYTGATGAVNLGAYDLTVQGLTIGKGTSALSNNSALGYRALFHITTGNYNTAVGYESSHNTTTGQYNTSLGQSALFTNTTGSQNTALGLNALLNNTTGGSNVVVGLDAMHHNTTGGSNTALGYNAGSHITGGSTPNTTASNSIYIGRDTRANVNGGANEIVIGNTVTGSGSNTVTIGNSSITANYFTGSINGGSFVKTGGTSSQFLKADGSVDSSTYYLASNPSAYIALTGLSATAPLSYNNTTGGFTISQAGVSANGYLSSTDWNTFNNKQAAGNYITALSGEATASGPGSAAVTLSTSAVTGKLLTGVNITGGSITATDSILVAFGKVQNQINGVLGGAIYQSTWNASTNSPALTSGTGTKGYYYIVSVAGSTNLDGITNWEIGDWAIFNGTTWNKVDNSDAVSSVNGFTGAVSLTTANISEVTNLYYTEGRVSANTDVAANTAARHAAVTLGTANGLSLSTQALSLALASTSATGALSSTDWNTFNLKQAALSGTGFVKISGSTISYDNSTYYLASNPNGYTTNVGTVTSVAMTVPTGLSVSGSPITTSGTLAVSLASGYSIPTTSSQATWDTAYSLRITTASLPLVLIGNLISMNQATTLQNGFLTYTDFNTFNNKQGTITLTTTGTSGAATFTSNTLNIPNYGSALSGYLPLTGGTLTGALGGTSASFSSTGRFIGALTIGTDFAQLLPISSSNYQLLVGSYYDGTNIIATATSGSRTVYNVGGMDFRTFTGATVGGIVTDISRFSIIASTGAATFSSSVTAGGQIISNLSTGTVRTSPSDSAGMLHIRPNQGQKGYITFTENAVGDRWAIGINNADGNLYFRPSDPTTTTVAYITSAGAATFSSSVTATGFFESSDSRLKTLIQDNYQTKGIASITPKLYTKNGKVELGYYAQDFVGVLDSAVVKGSDDMLSLSYREVLVAKVYALEQRIKELENK